MTKPRSNGQAQLDVLVGVRSALAEAVITASYELVAGLALAIRVLDGTIAALSAELDDRQV